MQYQVPQFIEVEDKIFGPLTLRQFIYLAGGGGLCLIFFTLINFYIAIFLSTPVVIISFGLAFYKFNGRPLIVAAEHAFRYVLGTKLYLWKQREPKAPPPEAQAPAPSALPVPKLSQSRLKDLAWSLNIKDRNRMGITDRAPSGFEI